jgi:hypothetical protein
MVGCVEAPTGELRRAAVSGGATRGHRFSNIRRENKIAWRCLQGQTHTTYWGSVVPLAGYIIPYMVWRLGRERWTRPTEFGKKAMLWR